MARPSLASVVADDLLDRIVAGQYPPDSPLPGENELTQHHEVSRLTIREAVKTLQARGVVRVERGRGTFVNPIGHWTDIEAIVRTMSNGNGTVGAMQLLELRRLLETGAARLAATRINDEEIAALRGYLEQMREAHERNDVDSFVEADIAFHDLVLQSTGNPFISVVFEPIKQVLRDHRWRTSAVPQIRANAIDKHATIIAAFASGNPDLVTAAMDTHIDQTIADTHHYVLTTLGAPGGEPDVQRAAPPPDKKTSGPR